MPAAQLAEVKKRLCRRYSRRDNEILFYIRRIIKSLFSAEERCHRRVEASVDDQIMISFLRFFPSLYAGSLSLRERITFDLTGNIMHAKCQKQRVYTERIFRYILPQNSLQILPCLIIISLEIWQLIKYYR